ncbi:lantibiotic dehydratase [Streptomyces sp. JJ66]|uniref:lantibiotic dehydratase n=1 Tax=Streptomyces sp. JJ66 TaxID=2803843 RepID=UPI001C581896|nr:lantibiotic dehydratase [Streptomyces sp. JJ66]MBW1604623.1 lantibiotic dehydratase [Streptomyces sp. JJ66]
MNHRQDTLYECADTALVRAARYTRLSLPPWPNVTSDAPVQVHQWHAWLKAAWALDEVSDSVEQASPSLARHMDTQCAMVGLPEARQVRRTLISVIRYIQRMTGRATPNGLFAGVAPAGFGERSEYKWGPWHKAVARVDAAWMSDVITELEACPDLLRRLPVVAANTAFVRGDRLIVPYPARLATAKPTAEVSLRFTSAVQTALGAARAPIACGLLANKVSSNFPDVPAARVMNLLTDLMRNGALVSSLHAPSSTLDALDHVVGELDAIHAHEVPSIAILLDDLRTVRDNMAQHNRALTPEEGRPLRRELRRKMTEVADTEHPLAVDLKVDCSLTLPHAVAREAEQAATVLARLTPAPFGTPGWKEYHTRFFEKYGIGSLVPLRDVVDPDVGLGFPAGFLDSEPEAREALTQRDQRLLALAQTAVLDGRSEVQLDEELITELESSEHNRAQLPPHLELTFQIHATSTKSLDHGDFTLSAIRPSRGIGTVGGRFLPLLEPEDHARALTVLKRLPSNTPGALPVQVSLPSLNRAHAQVTRVPELLPAVISLAEHRAADERTVGLDDLAVGCDRRRLYLASLSRRCLVEPHTVHALDLRVHTPPMARFLVEISRAQSAIITAFPWGAASVLPYLPRVRRGRTILAPARWLLRAADVPARSAAWGEWHEGLNEWCVRRRMPKRVALTEGDQLLPLDLSESAHRAVLRAHLAQAGTVVLTETSAPGDWFDGRAHEVVVPVTARQPTQWPTVAPVAVNRLLTRDHGHLPGTGPWLLAKLYGHPERQAEILSRHLPYLFAEWETPPLWWFMRHGDPQSHLRLRVAVPEAVDVGQLVSRIGGWGARLRRSGLLNDIQFATTYPETGRWGAGPLMNLAENIFAADSRAVAVQLSQPDRPTPYALTAANFVSLVTAFTGSVTESMEWLVTYGKITDPRRLARHVLAEAVRLADPTDGWAALRSHAGGPAITAAWAERDQAVARYRARLHESDLDPHLVLESLLHAHHIRAVGLDKDNERMCVRLARAAALAWTARKGSPRGTA